ncbi:MAG: hypothetical protein JO097_16305 [Acidobacteriaceae bacterium]|nr:hypothetical protein [Acidobacteriaceae bacterium]MBV9767661.1 hypothetical protein [Acidobacteriaceae bacterium]
MKTLIWSLAGICLWRSRIVQLITFALAAAVRGQYKGDAQSHSLYDTSAWSGRPPKSTWKGLNYNVLVTYHPEYHGFNSQRALTGLHTIGQLGAGWLRTDLRWRNILPDGKRRNPAAISWYRAFLQAAQTVGLKCMLVLSSPADIVLSQSSSARLESWRRFIEIVVAEFADCCETYQLMNEPNTPVYGFFSFKDSANAVVLAASIIHSVQPQARMAINVNMDFWGWQNYISKLLRSCRDSIDVIGLDHYPGTWTVGWNDRWEEVLQLAHMISSATPGSDWYQRKLMIMETGFSTNCFGRDQTRQKQYFENVIRVARRLKQISTSNAPLLGIYELSDSDTSAWLDPEAHFGLLTSDMAPKSAFRTVQHGIAFL